MKTFITFSPQQPTLRVVHYEPQNHARLDYGTTAFPIMPAISNYAIAGEPFRVILIIQDYEHCIANAVAFHQELEALCAEKGLVCQEVVELHVPFDNDVSVQIQTFQQLIHQIQDGDDLHACTTYGSKPATMTMLLALRYARQFMKNIYISCIVYGEYNFLTKDTKIYDETALVHLDDIVSTLSQMGTANPGQILESIIRK